MSDKAQIRLNAEQRAAVYCEQNAVVAAGAGSGKTSVLASRFAFLVTEKDYHVDQILTLTFTRKAAAEMYQRIYNTLSFIAANDSEVKQERAHRAIADFFHARIQTLDSYSTSIVKQAAVRYGIPPDFKVDEERCRALAVEEALPFLIAHRHHPAIEKLYRRKKPVDIANDLFAATISNYSAIDDPPDFVQDTKLQFEIVGAEWEKMTALIAGGLHELAELIAVDEQQDGFLESLAPLAEQFTGGKIVFPGKADIRLYFDSLTASSNTECIALAENHPVQGRIFQCLFFMDDLYRVNLSRGKRGSRAKEIIREIRSLFGAFSSLAVFCIQAGIILSLMSLLNDFQNILLERKRSEGVLTFNDVARLARTILVHYPDIRQNEKTAFRAIMIDEFQDNNELQKDLLFLLAERPERNDQSVPGVKDISPGKLFFVGDEKQSIYRFRGADVSVFRKLRDELGGADLPLKTNYRSAPRLIGAFNALFGGNEFDPTGGIESLPSAINKDSAGTESAAINDGNTDTKPAAEFAAIFASDSDSGGHSLPAYEASYTSLRTGSENDGGLTLCIFDTGKGRKDDAGEDGADNTNASGDEALDAIENEALFTAERIKKLLEGDYRPDDIAILFRAHGPQRLFEKHLRLLNIPYTSEGISGFFADGPVNDILSVLRLLAYPLDTEAYAVMLRSPFAGLSLQGLSLCLAAYDRARATTVNHRGPFSDEVLPLLSETDRVKFIRGQELYQRMGQRAAQQTTAELISALWYSEGYRYETEWNAQTVVYRELYDYLFALAAKADADGLSLAAFTDKLRGYQESGSRLEDMDIPLERSGAVRLMTIHKSKGLEFPVVFLCCCGSRGKNSGNDDEVYRTEDGGISCNPPLPPECVGMDKVKRNFFYEQGRAVEKRKKTAELRRLLYVAMTRAEKELFITGGLSLGGGDGPDTDDLPLLLRRVVEEKQAAQQKKDDENGTERIAGDTIIDNDTLFGLLLPAIADRIQEDTAEGHNRSAFFTLEPIPRYTEEYIKSREHQGAAYFNDRNGLAQFLAKAAPHYQGANSITTPHIERDHLTATSLRALSVDPSIPQGENDGGASLQTAGFESAPGYSGEDAADIFLRVDPILKRLTLQNSLRAADSFSPADFGSIAHSCVEALLNGEEARVPPRLGGHLSITEAAVLLSAGEELAGRFVQSPLGRAAQNAAFRKTEYPFRSLYRDGIFINGTIDLLFEADGTLFVVDFKTDSRENPAEHIPQMACYYRAASDLWKIPCRIYLYYLRTGHAVEMTGAVKDIKFEEIRSARPDLSPPQFPAR